MAVEWRCSDASNSVSASACCEKGQLLVVLMSQLLSCYQMCPCVNLWLKRTRMLMVLAHACLHSTHANVTRNQSLATLLAY